MTAPSTTPSARAGRPVVFVDGVRTPFGRARADGLYAHTRADDLAVKATRELLRRHPALDPERVEDGEPIGNPPAIVRPGCDVDRP